MSSSHSGPNPYLRTKILTASAEELRLMLYDGALKFARQARDAMGDGRIEDAYNGLVRAQKIVLELSSSLNHAVDPALCEKMASLYTYIYRLLVDANMERDAVRIDEAIKLLTFERETWELLMKKAGAMPGADSPAQIQGSQQTAISTYSESA